MISLLFLIGFPAIVIIVDFLGFLFTGKQIVNKILLRIVEIITLIVLPIMYAGPDNKNDCCSDSAVFSPEHRLTILVIIVLCLGAYFYSAFRNKIAPPILEILVNSFLLIGIGLNIFIAIHTKDIWLALLGNGPVILLAILMLAKNHSVFIEYVQKKSGILNNRIENIAWKILNLDPIVKFPAIFIICLPVLMILIALLLLFGQKPDSVVRAFTDTYNHGFSQWDYKCDNVQCGGHYLCTVAASGHPEIVKPLRFGIRNSKSIICNRQLLISNAFEELIEEKLPLVHKIIRVQYNKVGNFIHRYYRVFENKFVSDVIYILMKPLEWFFVFVLYTFDCNPENRISKQYLNKADKLKIEEFYRFNK